MNLSIRIHILAFDLLMKVAMGRRTDIELQYLLRSSALPYFTRGTTLIITAVCLIGGYLGVLCSPWSQERCPFQYARYPGAGRQSAGATHNQQLTSYQDDSTSSGSSQNDLDKCPGYHVASVDDTLPGRLSMDLFRRHSACGVYGKDVQHLKLEVTYESSMPTK